MNRETAIPVEEVVKELAPKRRFRPYPEYRDSGVDWLHRIPHNWHVVPLKRLFRVVNGSTPKSSEALFWDGEIPWATPDDLGSLPAAEIGETARQITREGYESCGTTLVPVASIVVSTRAPIGHLAIAAVRLCVNQGCRCLVPRSAELDSRYFYYELLAGRKELESWGQGSTFRELGKSELASIYLASPPFHEQRTIAAFLDRETGRIDELVAKKQRLIELLAEKRTALISHAVTKGLNPAAQMKDSGIEWLGSVPRHWTVKKLKFLAEGSLGNGLFKKKQFFGSGVRLVNVFDVYRDDFLVAETTLERVEADVTEVRKYAVRPGDVFFVRSSLKLEGVGKSACMFEITEPTVFECHLVCMRPNLKAMLPLFLINYLNSVPATNRLIALANQVTMTTIDQDKFKSLEVPVPPLQEQEAISGMIAEHTRRFFALTSSVSEAINKLREYRSALISAAVTGKIDVRGAA